VITFRLSVQIDKQACVVFVSEDQVKSKTFNFSNKLLKEQINALIASNQFSGEDGEAFPVLLGKSVALFVGVGAKKDLSLTALRITVRKALISAALSKLSDIEIVPHEKDDQVTIAIIEAVKIGTYVWKKYLTKKKE